MDPLILEELVDRYCAAWDEPDPALRRARLEPVWADEGSYTDPTVSAPGLEALVEHIARVIARYPGSRTVRTTAVDVHHGVLRFGWKKVLADGRSLPEGLDVGELSDDGKLRRVVGFFGPLAPRGTPE